MLERIKVICWTVAGSIGVIVFVALFRLLGEILPS